MLFFSFFFWHCCSIDLQFGFIRSLRFQSSIDWLDFDPKPTWPFRSIFFRRILLLSVTPTIFKSSPVFPEMLVSQF